MLRPGMYLQERYEIIEKIGSGGMADVYKAMCHTLNRLVAVKVLKEEFSRDENFVKRFKMEAQAAARLSHPNIVNVFDVVDDGDIHYIVMELIEGITLKSYIAKKGRLEVKETIGIAIQMAQGMSAAHQQNIIHRDIKPQNIIISRDGKVKVADFGIARAVTSHTQDRHAIGSVHYISPEQARGEHVDARSDIYSLGIAMFEMVTGRLPFDGENTVAVAMAHLENPITPPTECNPDIPESLEQIILTCTEKKPEDRYASAEEVIADLRRSLIKPHEVPGRQNGESRPEEQPPETGDEKRPEGHPESLPENKSGASGGKPSGSRPEDQESDVLFRADSEERKEKREESGGVQNDARLRKRIGKQTDISPQLERIFSAAGILAAILIVAVLLFVVLRLGGIFYSRSSGSQETAAESGVQEVTTAAIADGQVFMPSILGYPQEEAKKMLENYGLKMAVSSVEASDKYAVGCVMAQEINEGTVVEKNTTVNVKVSKGSSSIDLSLLGLEGMEQQAASLLLTGKGLVVASSEEFSETIPAGNVVRYEPQILRDGETVTLYISKGSARGLVPDVTGKSPEEAEAELRAAGFIPAPVGNEFSDTVEKGLVFNQTAEGGSTQLKGTSVKYFISLGPEETIIGATRYIGSINKQYNLSVDLGPGFSQTSVQIVIRLIQEVDGKVVVKNLIEPRTVVGDTVIPISFSRIEGADGVEEGTVELVNLDTGKVLVSYPVSFFKTEE
ncbi:MAG: Stk1 family PASTA domain-containing Ser/Thr kinase [Lachnospiraceae bacterium]|nr:Stk1 family PASTA domain-containing Ser/Thr kinase [Lachnospiraceae bacterium]